MEIELEVVKARISAEIKCRRQIQQAVDELIATLRRQMPPPRSPLDRRGF